MIPSSVVSTTSSNPSRRGKKKIESPELADEPAKQEQEPEAVSAGKPDETSESKAPTRPENHAESAQEEPRNATTPESDDPPIIGDHIDLAAEVERVSNLPTTRNELDTLLEQTPPELLRFLEEEFSAEFLGPVVVDPKLLD